MIVRGGYRLIPWWFRRAVYRPILSRYGGGGPQQPAPPDPAEGDCGGRSGEAPSAGPRLPVSP